MLPRLLFILVLALSTASLALLWMLVAQWRSGPVAWMAVVLAADAWIIMLASRQPAGATRALLTLGLTAASTASGLWLQVAGIVGGQFGLAPWQSAVKLGPALFSSVAPAQLGPQASEWLAVAAALAVASAWVGGPNARRRPIP